MDAVMSAECFLGIKPCDVSDQNHATTLRAATSPLSGVPFIDVKGRCAEA
jgi:hypothetical protein